MEVDTRILKTLMEHNNEKWRDDVNTGEVVEITLGSIGIGKIRVS